MSENSPPKPIGLDVLEPAFAGLVAVGVEGDGAALAEPAAVVGGDPPVL